MRRLGLLSTLVLCACGSGATFVRSDQTTLGHIVVYKSGVAYFERTAVIDGDTLTLQVPAERVDDFLKSLTVTDAATGQPAPIAYPTDVAPSKDGVVEMKIALVGPKPHRLKLSYVTEAPSWKPSYRVALGEGGRLGLQAWAIVDNTSGEDWKDVKLGVGSSSAMSFRFDLRSLRLVQRVVLQANDLFAAAPPIGGATYDQRPAPAERVLTALTDQAIALAEPVAPRPEPPQLTPPPSRGESSGKASRRDLARPPTVAGGAGAVSSGAAAAVDPMSSLALSVRGSGNTIVIEGFADASDPDKNTASLARANKVREQLVRRGVDPNRVVAVGKGKTQAGGGVRIVETQAPSGQHANQAAPIQQNTQSGQLGDPIGTAHFESGSTITVPRGTSAMVSILEGTTEGEVVYLFDPESQRGSSTFAFRAVRIKNPTESVLESGPVTVFGEGRFIGEGLSEPIPARSVAFVPFALDRQIVVEAKNSERDEIARVITVQRGVFSTEVQHTRSSRLTLHNRLDEKATVYVRHTVPQGYELSPSSPKVAEKIGGAALFKVEIAPRSKSELLIEERTPLFKTTDIRTPGGMDLVRVYLSAAAMSGALKTKVGDLLELQKQIGDNEQRIATTREQMSAYKERMNELHAQIVTLKLVKTAGPLMRALEKKLAEVSEKLSQATVSLVSLEEQLMISRIHFQDGVADLTLEPGAEDKAQASR